MLNLRKYLAHKELGWTEIDEKFTRYSLFKTKWFNVYLHQLNAPKWAPTCHDHPWSFVAVLLWRGYYELLDGTIHRRWPGSILWRPAETSHNVITHGTSWSLIFTGPRVREWGHQTCRTLEKVHENKLSESEPKHPLQTSNI